MAQDTRIGSIIAGYRIERLLGRGGMSVVYLAEQDFPNRKVALKLLAPELAEDQVFRDRFIRESNAAASIDHPNVIPIYGAGDDGGVLWIAMRYVEGEDLGRLLEREGPLPLERAVTIVSQVGQALDAAHERGLVHRDVKPGNVLIGKGDHAYLTDFGLIKRREGASRYTKTGQFMGSVDYAAPEQIRGEEVDHRADVYSLGCVLYECLTGRPPYPREAEVAVMYAHLNDSVPSVSDHRPELPKAIDATVSSALAKRPEDRPGSAGDLVATARSVLERVGASGASTDGPRPRHRLRVLSGLAAVLVVSLATLGLVLSKDHGRGAVPGGQASGTRPASAPPLNSLVEVDPGSGKIVSTIHKPDLNLASLGQTSELAIGEGGLWLRSYHYVQHVDEQTKAVRAPIFPGIGGGGGGALAVGYRTVWLATLSGLATIDPATDETIDTEAFPKFGNPTAVAVGDNAVWLGFTDGTLARIDPRTEKVVGDANLGGSVDAIEVGAGGVWVIDRLQGTVSRVDPATMRVRARTRVGGDLTDLAVGFGTVWVLDSGSGTVTALDAERARPAPPIRVGQHPSGLAAGFGYVWVPDQDGKVYRINPGTLQVSPMGVGSPLAAIGLDQSAKTIWLIAARVGESP